ncbi:hypothetical protein E4U41_001166 [Claviceps citrina]|nr:hypothetical protein E4U41_001166 [Claviceps citrina]
MGSERWDRDRVYERDRAEDDRYYSRGPPGRERSEERFDRRRFHDDYPVRGRRFYDDEPRYEPRREPARQPEFDRRVVMEKERDRDLYRHSSPHRPGYLRRQSSLDTYDRRAPRPIFDQREEYPPPARREDIYRDDFRAPPYTPIPLPKARGLPPTGRRDDRFYDDLRPSEPEYYPDADLKHLPERVREREYIRERDRRDRSRESRATRTHTHRSSSRSTSSSRSSSSAGGTSVRSEYPKKGKTKIPVRLVSKRALIDLGYPFIEEENTIIVQKALGQDNIDELLKLSEEYIRADEEVANARSSAGNLIEERIEERRTEILRTAGPPPQPAQTTAPPPPPPATVPAPPPTVVPPSAPAPGPVETVEYVDKVVIRDSSPTRSSSSWDSGYHRRRHHHHHHRDDGVLVLASRSRSRSRSRRDIRAEIKALERELVHRPKGEIEREVVRTERLPNGELIIYEEEVERTVARPKPPRIEKDKKGRMSISIPKYR